MKPDTLSIILKKKEESKKSWKVYDMVLFCVFFHDLWMVLAIEWIGNDETLYMILFHFVI